MLSGLGLRLTAKTFVELHPKGWIPRLVSSPLGETGVHNYFCSQLTLRERGQRDGKDDFEGKEQRKGLERKDKHLNKYDWIRKEEPGERIGRKDWKKGLEYAVFLQHEKTGATAI